ncbi:MAG: hypothetical protein ACOCXV_00570 [Bacteroidota bacterium]
MKQIIFTISMMLMICSVSAFDPEPIVVFKDTVTIADDYENSLAFAKGDLVILKYREIKDRNINAAKVFTYDKLNTLYHVEDKFSRGVFQYEMQTDDVLTFYFEGRGMLNRKLEIEIQRIPASAETVSFSSRYMAKNITHEYTVKFQNWEFTGEIKEEEKDHELKLFDKYVLEDVVVWDHSRQLKGIIDFSNSRHEHAIGVGRPPVPEAKPYRTSVSFASVIGGSKHWDIVNSAAPLTVSVVSSFFLTPAGGAAVGAGAGMMLNHMGPKPDAEPTMIVVGSAKDMGSVRSVKSPSEALRILNNDLGETYAANMTSLFTTQRFSTDRQIVMMQNLDPHKAKNIKANFATTFYAPLYKPVIAKEKKFIPQYNVTEETRVLKHTIASYEPWGPLKTADGRPYSIVEYPDTIWTIKQQPVEIKDIVSIVPRVEPMKYQVTTKSDLVYSQTFAALPDHPLAAKVRLPEPINDEYQTMRYKQIKYTLTVGDATYNALKGHMATVLESGISYGFGKGVGAVAGKMGKTKVPGDESMNMVEKILDAKEKYETTAEIVETSTEVKDIYENGSQEEEEEEEEAFFIQNGEKVNTVLHKTGNEDADVTQYIPEDMLTLEIPSIAQISQKGAGAITPKIKDKIRLTVYPSGQPQNVVLKKETGFLVDSIPINGNLDFTFLIENPREILDLANLLSVYVMGTLTVEVEYEQINYKDMLVFDEIRTPITDVTQPVQEYKVEMRRKYVHPDEIKPHYRIIE